MSDFSLTTLFVVPVGNSLPSSGSTQDLNAGQFGIFLPTYLPATSGNIDDAGVKYFYLAQGRTNTYLQGSKRSDRIAGYLQNGGSNQPTNVTKFYKISACTTAANQITDVDGWNVKCGDVITLTLRAFSSYLETLYYNGFTRSVTVQAPCCDCGGDPCDLVDVPALIDSIIVALETTAPGINPDNIGLTQFYTFERLGDDADAILRIQGKPLTVYGQPCDLSAFPWEYDKMRFNTFVYNGPATTADFIVDDNCDVVATATVVQESTYQPAGSPDEIRQLEKDYMSYQSGNIKAQFRVDGYNVDFESWVSDSAAYDQFVIQFTDIQAGLNTWNPQIKTDSRVIIACPTSVTAGIEAILEAALGSVTSDNTCITTTTTTTTSTTTTTTTTAP